MQIASTLLALIISLTVMLALKCWFNKVENLIADKESPPSSKNESYKLTGELSKQRDLFRISSTCFSISSFAKYLSVDEALE